MVAPPPPFGPSLLSPGGATRAVQKRNRGGKWRLGSAYLVFLAPPGLSFFSIFVLAWPVHSALAFTGASVSPHALPASPSLSLSLSLGAPTPPPFLFLQFPPPPSSILSIPHPRADPGFIPCWCPRRPACEFFVVRPSDFMSPLCLFLHCPMPALFCLHPAAWLMCVSLYLFHFQCYSFHPCAPSSYDRTYPTLEPVLLRLHFFICMFFSLPV